jgi:hypothetical protein
MALCRGAAACCLGAAVARTCNALTCPASRRTRRSRCSQSRGGGYDAFAFLWANRASTASYSPNPAYTYVPGAEPHVRRTAPGRYEATLNAEIGNLQVTAYGAPGVLCNPVSWGPQRASIACHAPSGQPADARFAVLSTRRPESLAPQVDLAVAFSGLPANLRPGEALGPLGDRVIRDVEHCGRAGCDIAAIPSVCSGRTWTRRS